MFTPAASFRLPWSLETGLSALSLKGDPHANPSPKKSILQIVFWKGSPLTAFMKFHCVSLHAKTPGQFYSAETCFLRNPLLPKQFDHAPFFHRTLTNILRDAFRHSALKQERAIAQISEAIWRFEENLYGRWLVRTILTHSTKHLITLPSPSQFHKIACISPHYGQGYH